MTQVLRAGSAAEFLAATTGLRAREPVLTNILGSVALGIQAGRQYDRVLALLAEVDGEVVGCALQTDGHPVLLSPMPTGAAVALGGRLRGEPVTALVGPAPVVTAVVDVLGVGVQAERRDVARVLVDLVPPRSCVGGARPATPDDAPVVVPWYEAFATEAGVPGVGAAVTVAVAVEQGRLRIWEVDGTPVALAGHALPVPGPTGAVGRIGPVYTPPEHRGQGYASALTYAIACELQTRCEVVMLYADAANPSSNHLYARLGFEVVGEVVEVQLAGG